MDLIFILVATLFPRHNRGTGTEEDYHLDLVDLPRVAPISRIQPGLFVGHITDSYNVPLLAEKKIGAMVSLVPVPLAAWSLPANRALVPADRHVVVPCDDSTAQDLLALIPHLCDFIDAMRGAGHAVLVHCVMGRSRSVTVAAAHLMRRHHVGVTDAVAAIRSAREHARPNSYFWEQLDVWAVTDCDLWWDIEQTKPKPAYAAYLRRRARRLRLYGLTGNEPPRPTPVHPQKRQYERAGDDGREGTQQAG